MGIETSVIFQIAGIGLVVAFLNTLLKQLGKDDFSSWITLIGFILILFIIANQLQNLFIKIKDVFLFQ